MYDEFKERRFASPPLLKRLVMAGWYGRKSGRGFYITMRIRRSQWRGSCNFLTVLFIVSSSCGVRRTPFTRAQRVDIGEAASTTAVSGELPAAPVLTLSCRQGVLRLCGIIRERMIPASH